MNTYAVNLKQLLGPGPPALDRAIAELLRRFSPGFASVLRSFSARS